MQETKAAKPASPKKEEVKIINGYTFKKPLGRGAYGVVYLAEKEGKSYAIKEQKLRLSVQEGIRREVILEADILIRFNHPNLIFAFDTFTQGDNIYFVEPLGSADLLIILYPSEANKKVIGREFILET